MTQPVAKAHPDRPYLRYIAESLRCIEEYLGTPSVGPDKRGFFDDMLTQDAVVWRLRTLADSAAHLPDELKRRNPEARWEHIGAIPGILTEGYLRIDLNRAWDLIASHLPLLRAAVVAELAADC